mgnify:CR=1 FL=1
MAGYYYRQLDREKRGVYDAMLAGMEALAPGIRVPRLDGPELSDIYLRLKLDTPLLFYVTGFQYRWMPGADHVELLPEYLFDKGKIRQHRQAVAARLGEKYGLERLPETGALYQVQFSILRDTAALMLDTTGPGLYKRGYRAVGVAAPLRETLAAAMVLLSRYRGRDPFCDPFCGSGTIPIEAALIAKNRAPGLDRSFSAQRWSWLPARAWMEAAEEAMDKEYQGTYDIWGGDIDPQAVALARSNAEKAGVEDLVRFQVADARRFARSEPYGRIVTNPPYGERMLEKKEAEGLYRDFGTAFRALPAGWSLALLSSHTEFERTFGAPAQKKRKLYNGMLKCDLFLYGKRGVPHEKT